MPDFPIQYFRGEISDADFNAAVDARVNAIAPAIVTALGQQFFSTTAPTWFTGGGGGGAGALFQLGTPVTITSTDFSPVLTFNYTPKSATSKLIFLGLYNVGQSAPNITSVALFRGSTNLALAGLPGHDWIREPNLELADIMTLHGFLASDMPNSATEQSYSIKAKVLLAGQISHVGKRHNSASDGPMPPGMSVLVLDFAA